MPRQGKANFDPGWVTRGDVGVIWTRFREGQVLASDDGVEPDFRGWSG